MIKTITNIFKKLLVTLLIIGITINIVFQLLLTMSGIGISILDIYAQTLPKKDTVKIEYSDTYLVRTKSYFERQDKGQCAGFSSAYVLRILKENFL